MRSTQSKELSKIVKSSIRISKNLMIQKERIEAWIEKEDNNIRAVMSRGNKLEAVEHLMEKKSFEKNLQTIHVHLAKIVKNLIKQRPNLSREQNGDLDRIIKEINFEINTIPEAETVDSTLSNIEEHRRIIESNIEMLTNDTLEEKKITHEEINPELMKELEEYNSKKEDGQNDFKKKDEQNRSKEDLDDDLAGLRQLIEEI